jgi:hypothetical protein
VSATVDTHKLNADLSKLVRGLERAGDDTARQSADETARAIAAKVPRRTGALAGTVGTTKIGDGYGVTYGGGLRYAWPMEKRFHAVNASLDGADRRYQTAAQTAADRECNRI